MKRSGFILICFLLSFLAQAQPFGNEWIDYSGSKQYYFFKVSQTGIHRIDYNALVNAGINVSSINPENFQVYGRQKEIDIHVENAINGAFSPGDYIEFYAEKNDGRIDSLLYRNALDTSISMSALNMMPDTFYSLYNDTTCYYLTWNTSGNNRRMVELTDTNYSAYTPLNWVWYTTFIKIADEYVPGKMIVGSSSSHFTASEGWYSGKINSLEPVANYYETILNTSNAYTGAGAPDAQLTTSAAGVSHSINYTGSGNHHFRVEYGPSSIILTDNVFIGYKLIKQNHIIPAANLTSPSFLVRYKGINDQGASSDYFSIASTSLRFPHTTDLGGATSAHMDVPYNVSEIKSRLSFTNPSGNNLLFYDLTDTVKRINITQAGSNFEVLLPNQPGFNDSRCFITDTSSIIYITDLNLVNGTGYFTDYASIIPDSAYIILTHTSLLVSAQAYAAYRSSPAGRNFNTLVVDVEELYHQYGAGIQKHILGVRRFMDHMISTAPVSYLFILGKSVRESSESNGSYPGSRKSAIAFENNLVPSYGYPCSDVLITAGLDTTFIQPEVPTGRIAAKNDGDVYMYLNKVQVYEAAQDPNSVYDILNKDWMKHVLHFGGGANSVEQDDFKDYLATYEGIIEDTLFGGEVHSFYKQSSDPIDPVEYDEVMTRVAEGVSLMTFFGHSTINGFDQNLDEPENWNNYGKYPFLIGNSCYSGDIHQPDPISTSEAFVLIPDEGVIGFLSTVKQGFVPPLYSYTLQFYNEVSHYSYGKPVGDIIRNVITAVMPNELGLLVSENVCTQMTLHCDPAVRLNFHPAPELVIRSQDIFFEPAQVTVADDSVVVNIIVTNIGKAFTDSVVIELHRIFPDGADSIYHLVKNGFHYKDTVQIKIPVLHNIATGLNLIDVFVDVPSYIPEHADEIYNNEATASLYIYGNGIIPVYPYEFAIIPEDTVTLKASTFDPVIGAKNYRFEIDTTDLFNSPLHLYQIVNAAGGVVNADPSQWRKSSSGILNPLTLTDSTVYFWRVTPDSSTYLWRESSFQYIQDQRGWGQAHHFQFEDNYHQNLHYSRTGREWYWEPNIRKISVDVWGNANNASHFNGTLWTLDGVLQDYNGCQIVPALHVAVIDPISLEAWGTYWCNTSTCFNQDHQFGSDNNGSACRNRVEYFFSFRTDNGNTRDSLISMINNHVPDGFYFVIYTWRYADYSVWTPQLYSLMDDIGADSIYSGRQNEPFIILGRKGDPSFTKTVIGQPVSGSTAELITLSDTLFGFDYLGAMHSPAAGPANEWDALYWKQESQETPSTDSARISVFGITNGGAEQLLMDTLLTPEDSIINLNGIVDASIYPYVRLKSWLLDTTFFTPAQLKRWQLLYDPVPEAAVSRNLGFYFSAINDTLGEGQELKIAIAVKNISEYHMDSLLVHYWIEDHNRSRIDLVYPLQDSLRAGDILLDTVTVSTTGLSGLNSIWLEVNPVPKNSPPGSGYDQPEQFHGNNLAHIPFFVSTDNTNPILDVTFDGVHIINGDIVSTQPMILITLNDENPWLVLDSDEDTSVFAVYLTDPAGNQERVYFMENGIENMRFTPATGPNDKFKIELNPQFRSDGVYTLLIQASDKSGNDAGDVDYKIQFEIYSKPSITHILNYPNPFSTKTHFVFTLTGTTPPDYIKIQIMTITGKIVREITRDELGDLKIGRNITDYYWDGTDMFGDQLANGVYLYRVIVKNAGQILEHRETAADPYFVKGYGKMYLMR